VARPRRYGFLLLLLILTYLLSAFTSGGRVAFIQIVLFAAVAILTLQSTSMRRGAVRLITGLGLLGSAIAAWLAVSQVSEVSDGIANIWAGLVLLLTVIVIVQRVLTMVTVTLQSIFGAVSAYLILGLMFAAFYAAMFHLGGNHFFAGGRPGTTQTFQYFSFTTLTTLGYGDFTAAQSSGQAVAVIEALTGQVFLATLVARLVASFRAPQQRARASSRRKRQAGHSKSASIDLYGTVASRQGTARSARRSPAAGAVARSLTPPDGPRHELRPGQSEGEG
jgi:voltage-gated potassium channel Kch